MREKMYSVEEVADLLGLHVRTVRGYIRDGRLEAVRIGKQYRIAGTAIEALTGDRRPAPGRAWVEVSSIVHVDGADRATADRLGALLQAGAGRDPAESLNVQTVHDRERDRLKIMIIGGPAATADVLRLLDGVLDDLGDRP